MANTRELSQLASLISVNDDTKSISVIFNLPDAKLGIGTKIAVVNTHLVALKEGPRFPGSVEI